MVFYLGLRRAGIVWGRGFATLATGLALSGCFSGSFTWTNLASQSTSSSTTTVPTGPTVTITTPAAGAYVNASSASAVIFIGTCTEEGAAVNLTAPGGATATATCTSGAWTVPAGMNLSAEAEGSLTITATHFTATPTTVTVVKDTVVSPPTLSSSPTIINMANVVVAPFTVNCPGENGTILVTGSATASIPCTSGSNAIAVDLSSATDGFVSLSFAFRDAASNTSTTANWGPVTKDTVAPGNPSALTFNVSSPTNLLSIVLTGTPASVSDTIKVFKDATCTTLMTTGTGSQLSTGISIGLPANSVTPLYVQEFDAAGNTSACVMAHAGFMQDSIAPTVSGLINDGTYSVTAGSSPSISLTGVTATDGSGSGVFKLQYGIGVDTTPTNVTIRTWTDVPATTFTATGLTGLTSGTTYYVKVRALDNAGNIGTALVSDGWIFDNTPPVLTVTPAELATVSNPVNISGSCESGLTINISYGLGFTGPTAVTCTAGAYSFAASVNWLDGIYYVVVSETDAAGNLSTVTRNLNYTMPSGTWAPMTLSGTPSGRFNHTAVWDSGTQSMIVWGGQDLTGPLGDGFAYDIGSDTWFPLAGGGPTARTEHTGLWLGAKFFVWGGMDTPTSALSDGYLFDGSSWTAVSATSAPTARYGHDAVWTGSDVYIWGGFDGTGSPITLGDGKMYNLSSDTWYDLAAGGTPPAARGYHRMAMAGTKLVVWGGAQQDPDVHAGPTYYSDGGVLNSGTWMSMAPPTTLTARVGHTMLPNGNTVVIWGGRDDSAAYGDGEVYDAFSDSWSSISPGGAPTARAWHTAVDAGAGKMIIWGGNDASGVCFDDGGVFYAGAWSSITNTDPNTPVARRLHTAVWTGTYMIVWGGEDDFGNPLDDGAIYKP